MSKQIVVFSSLLLFLSAMPGCAPKITVIHQDPTTKRVVVRVDNEEIDTIKFGQKTSETVSRGLHYVEAIPEGQSTCPWADDGKGWSVWVDNGSVLTLFPIPPAQNQKDRELPSPYENNDTTPENQPADSDDQ